MFGSESLAGFGSSVGGGHSCDVNGDGFDDIVVSGFTSSVGQATVILGHNATKYAFGDMSMSALTSSQGFTIKDPNSGYGFVVACAGDVNKDGVGDIVIGVPLAGRAFVIYGRRGAQSNIDLSLLTASVGFKISNGAVNTQFGFSVDGAGDVNGDGYSDVIVGSPQATANSGVSAGLVYVFFGAASKTNVDLSTFTTSGSGFQVLGSAASNTCGTSVSGVGDINGDGYADFIVGCPNEVGLMRTGAGVAYVVFGKATFSTSVNLMSFTSASGYQVVGDNNVNLGTSVSRAGDVNHDGVPDFFVAMKGVGNVGGGIVIFGQRVSNPSARIIDTQGYVSGTAGFAIYGPKTAVLGAALSNVGDFNGDGIDDVVITSIQQTVPGRGVPGTAFVIFGHSNITTFTTIDLSALSYGSWGFQLIGEEDAGCFGVSVRSAGDFNKDGYMDLLIGAKDLSAATYSENGVTYVVFGNSGWTSPTAAPTRALAPSTNVFTNQDLTFRNAGVDSVMISGAANSNQFGEHTNHGQNCDVNGDGIHDLLICTTFANSGAGAAYVIYGHTAASLPFADFSFATEIDSRLGYQINGAYSSDNFGSSCSCAGDVNGDGVDDIILGASTRTYGNANAGAAYVLYGRRGLTNTINLVAFAASAQTGFLILTHDANTYLGTSVDGAGDVNNDGYADVIVGAPTTTIGSAIVVFGGPLSQNILVSSDLSLAGVGFRLTGVDANGKCGTFVSGVGRFNADVYADVAMGCPGSAAGNGSAYIYMGVPNPVDYNIAAGFSAVVGVMLTGSAGSNLGRVSRAGDVNHDGLDDVIVGAPQAFSGAGAAVVLLGKISSPYVRQDLQDLRNTGSGGKAFLILGKSANYRTGTSVGRLGDCNGDGIDDLIISAPGAMDPFQGRGATGLAYVILGKTTPFTTIQLASMETTASASGFLVIGKQSGDSFGAQVHGAGDFNNDGLADLLLSSPNGNSAAMSGNGQVYVMFGRLGMTATQPPSWRPTAPPSAYPSFAPIPDPTLAPTSRAPTLRPTSSPVFERPTADIALSLYSNTQVTGISLFGVANDVNFGNAVSDCGDFNGDGKPDIIIGSYANDQNGGNFGAAYIVFGGYTLENFDFIGFAPGPRGIRIFGGQSNAYLGFSVKGAGDFNGDGFSDVIVGAYGASYAGRSYGGITYIIFGHGAPYSDVYCNNLGSGSIGLIIGGAVSGDYSGYAVSGIGDFNGDGYGDVAIGAYLADFGASGTDSGTCYVIYGRPTGNIASDIDLASFSTSTTQGFRVYGGTSSAFLGYSVSGAGDVNGDNLADFIVGSYNWNGGYGCAYVIFGRAGAGDLDLTGFSSNVYGFRIVGYPGYQVGWSVSALGDVNGDGLDDVIVGAPGAPYSSRSSCGAAFVVFGKNYLTTSVIPDAVVTSFANNQGFSIYGEGTSDRLGVSVGRAYDVSRDGIADIIVGAPSATRNGMGGVAYVVFGKVTAPMDVDLAVPNFGGYRLLGAGSPDQAGCAVSGARDFNQDGYNDIIVGAMGATVNGQGARGRAYIIYGSAVTPTSQPSSHPSSQPSRQPSTQPSRQPTSQPSAQPSRQPMSLPSSQPTSQPSAHPSTQPSRQPTSRPSVQPSGQPSSHPSSQPSAQPSRQPVGRPSAQPSSQPSRQPSSHPSSQPSIQPVSMPTTQPSMQPSSQPSAQPSGQPVGRPSAQPSSQPSRQPSSLPSSQPSQQPVAAPSSQPSAQPSRQPSGRPSSQPSRQPSSRPTTQPSSQPSAHPTSQPTRQPTSQPSARPSAQPTALPSAQPSGQPIGHPTSQPSASPSTQPTAQPTSPTSRPTGQPSCQPSSVPSGQPSTQPSSLPTCQPSAAPTSQPSGNPTARPSSQPSSLPSSVPTSLPSTQPSSQPSDQPSTCPSAQPSAVPSRQPTALPTSQPSIAPTSQPSSVPSAHPSSHPSVQPSAQPSSQPTAQPSMYPTVVYNASVEMNTFRAAPNITSMVITSVNKTTLTVSILNEGRLETLVYCGAFASTSYKLASTNEIVNQNVMTYSVNGMASVRFSNLHPSTDYRVYCMTATLQGTLMSMSNTVRNIVQAQTLCCKTVTASLLTSSVYVGKSAANAVSVTYDVPPSAGLTVSVSFASTSFATPATTSYPSSLALTASDSLKSARLLRVVAGAQDTVELLVTLSGPSASEYSVQYTNGRRAVKVISLNVEPPLPVLQQAQFSNDGGSVVLTFDSPTDKAGYSNVFPCLTLLAFDGASTATCQWTDPSTAVVYPKYAGVAPVLSADSHITLSAGHVHAKCTSNSTELCSAWAAVSGTSLTVLKPANPTAPVVSFPLPSTVSACNSLLIDLTASSGAAGRPWAKVNIKVLTSGGGTIAATLLQHFLDANFTYSPPTVVPTYVLTPGYLFSIQATMCNYLGTCGVAVRTVTVLMAPAQVPITSINGQKQRNVYRSALLVLNGITFTQSCADSVSYSNIAYTWAVRSVATDGTTSATSLQSASQNAAVFKLAPYALAAGSVYDIILTATSSVSGLSSSAKATITVLSGDLVAKISQGSVFAVEVDSTVTLDASGSSDQDVATSTGWSAGLSFSWTCEQIEPVFSPNCSAITTSLSVHADVNSIRAGSEASDSTFRFTVTVYDATRSNSAYTDVTVTATPQSQLRITNTVASVTSVDSKSTLTLLGSLRVHAACTAAWSVDDSSVNIAAVALTSTAKIVTPTSSSAYVPFNLVVAGGVLAQRSSFAFTLQCGESSALVTVTTNGAPLPGEFIITPTIGTELVTMFTFTAVQWSDPDLPITYQFGYESPSSASTLVMVSATEKTYTQSLLPAGLSMHGDVLNCSLYVFDSFSASSVAILNVTVSPILAENKDSAIAALLQSNTGSVNDAKRILSVASTALNQANCSLAPNCTALHRSRCAKTSGECGDCISGYVGTSGDSNQFCVAVNTLRSPLLGLPCSADETCFLGQTCDFTSGVCAFPVKTCSKDCSGHGSCELTNVASGVSVTNCTLVDSSCTASCRCSAQFSGRACEITADSLATNRAFRSQLLDTLQNLTSTEDVNAQSVSDWSASLYALALNPFELSHEDMSRMLDLANYTVTNAVATGVTNYASLEGVLQAANAVASVSNRNYASAGASLSDSTASAVQNNTAGSLVTVVSAFADLVTSSKALGENDTVYLFDNFRVSAGLVQLSANATSLSVQSPQTDSEKALGARTTTATLTPTTTSGAEDSVVAMKVVDVHPHAYTADTSAFVSNPLYLQLSALDGRAAYDVMSELVFRFEHIQAVSQYDNFVGANFTSECQGLGASENYTFVCPNSGIKLVNNCSAGAGEYVLNCPKLTPGCAQVGLYNAEIDVLSACVVTDFSATHTTCQCAVNGTSGDSRVRSRRLADTIENQVMAATGVTNMLATSSYVVMEFADTFNAAPKFNSPDSVVIVIYMFSTLWGAGLLILSVCLTKGYVSKRERAKQAASKVAVATTAVLAGSKASSAEVAQSKRVLLDYFDGVLPSVYDETKSSMGRMLGELRAHHRYLSVFTLGDGQISLYGKLLVIGKLLTVETMQMFVLAMLYDLQGPENDGSCVHLYSESACLSRKSIFDSAVTYCEWTNVPDAGDTNCYYHREQFTIKITLYILVLTSIFSSIFATPLDYLFKVCSAPLIENALRAQVAKSLKSRRTTVVKGLRRMSALSVSAVRAARRSTVAAKNMVTDKTKGFMSLFAPSNPADNVIANREISEDVEQLHIQAVAVLPGVSANADAQRREKKAAALLMKNKAMSRRLHMSESDSDLSEATIDRDSFDPYGAIRAPSTTSFEEHEKPKGTAASRVALQVLCDEVIAQRELMPKDSPYTSEFDTQWGIQTTIRPASTCRTSALGNYKVTFSISEEARSDILETIIASDEQAAELNENMPRYTLHHGGLAVLNMFVLDLLGRTTSAAKIFRNKFEEDFEETKAVSRWYQTFAVAVLLGCNGFFIYYSLLKAFQKGTTWQYKYLQGCIVQLLVELFLNETIECIWLNFIVPDLVRKQVKKATIVINKVVEQITESANARSGRSILFLDATPFLFSSTKVAQAHPSLLESVVVLNYQSHLPGELSKTWPHCAQVATASQRYADRLANEGKTVSERVYQAVPTMILAISTFIVLSLQGLGTMSFGVQRTVLRFLQPLIMSGLTLMWFFASKSTVGLVVMIVAFSLFAAAFAWRQYYVHKLERALNNSAAPFDDSAFIDLDGQFEDVESVPNSPKNNSASDKERNFLSLHRSCSEASIKSESTQREVACASPVSPVNSTMRAKVSFLDSASSGVSSAEEEEDDVFVDRLPTAEPVQMPVMREVEAGPSKSVIVGDACRVIAESVPISTRMRVVSFDSSAESSLRLGDSNVPPFTQKSPKNELRRRSRSASRDVQEEPTAESVEVVPAQQNSRRVHIQEPESKEQYSAVPYDVGNHGDSRFMEEMSMKRSFSFLDDEADHALQHDHTFAQELSMKHSFSFLDNEQEAEQEERGQEGQEGSHLDDDREFAHELSMKRSFSFADSDADTDQSDAAVASQSSSVPARLSAALRLSRHGPRDSRVNQQAAAMAAAARALEQAEYDKKSAALEASIRSQRAFSFDDSNSEDDGRLLDQNTAEDPSPISDEMGRQRNGSDFSASYFALDLSKSSSGEGNHL